MDRLKAKTEIKMRLNTDPLFANCPDCGGPLIKTWQPTKYYDDSSPVRMCEDCDKAWIWPYPEGD